MPAISVIVPVYNVEKYLSRCVDSVLAQTFSDFELILVDDGSPDNCGSICDSYAAIDNRVKVIHQNNSRLSAARNAGISIARGEWIALIDSDDWIHKDYLRLLYQGAKKETDIVICDCLVTSNETEQDCNADMVCFEDCSLSGIMQNRIARTRAWGRILRRTTIGDLRYISGTEPAEDSCFNELLFEKNMRFRYTSAKLYYYYMRSDSAIHKNMGRGTLNSIEPLIDRLQKIDDPEKRRRIIQRCYKNIFYPRYLEMYTHDYDEVKARCKKLLRLLRPYLRELSFQKQVLYGIFAMSPMCYRLWRVIDDPTMIDWEKHQRKLLNIKQ